MNGIFENVDLLSSGMRASLLRGEVISNNIANVDTVGFRTSQVEFETLFAKAMESSQRSSGLTVTDPRHIGGAADRPSEVMPEIVSEGDTSLRMDENNVDIEHEMVEMAKNTLSYYTLVSQVNSQFNKLQTAINVT